MASIDLRGRYKRKVGDLMMKGEYQIFKILRDSCIKCLNEMGITDNFDVRRFAQANVANGDRLVLLNLIHNQRVGWQAFEYRYNKSKDKEERSDEWIEQQSWQISIIKKMRQDDTVDTVSSEDIATALMTWFNGVGNLNLRSFGIANLPIDPRSIMIYNDDSDLYQRRVVFTMELQVPKSFTTESVSVSKFNMDTKPV
jgi:hypothetical protein